MKNYRLILAFIFLLAAVLRADLTGDLNHDGKLDVADLVRIKAMIANALAPEACADLDKDGAVSATDADMLLGLLRGTYSLPLDLDFEVSYEVDPQGGEEAPLLKCYSGDGFKLSWPNYAGYGDDNTALWTVEELPEVPLTEDFPWELSKTIGISNMPYRDEVAFSFAIPENATGTPALLVGTQSNAKGAKESLWSYQILLVNSTEDDDEDVPGGRVYCKDNKLIWKPNLPSGENCMPSISCTVIYPASPSDTRSEGQTRGSSGGDDLGINFKAHDMEGGLLWYSTTHFEIWPYFMPSLNDIQRLAKNLEKAYRVIGGLGFNQNFPWNWGKVKVNVVCSGKEPEDSYCVEPGLFGPSLEFNQGVLVSDRIGSIAIHELMHYHHYNYAQNYKSLWLEEICTAWSERLMSDDPENYRPQTFGDIRGVLDGLPMKSEKPSYFFGSTVNKAASSHGYDLYPFAVWLAKKYPAEDLWHSIFASRGYANDQALTALIQGLWVVDKNADIGELYGEFIREYFGNEGTIPYPFQDDTPRSCFDSADATRFAKNGMKSNIREQGDLFLKDTIEHTFHTSQLGASTWLFTFKNGSDEFMKEYSEAIVKANGTQYDFFVLHFKNGKFYLTAPEEILRDEEKNVSYIKIPMESIIATQRSYYFGIVAVNHNYDEYNDDAYQDMALTVAFSGPLVVSNLVAETPYDVFINGVYRWIHEYTKVKNNLVFTPLGGTTFSNSNVCVYDVSYKGVKNAMPVVRTELVTDVTPDTLEVNITGAMTDIPVPMFLDNSSTLYFGWGTDFYTVAECTGHYVVKVSKTVGKYSYDVNFTTEGVGEYNAVYGGMTYTAEDFLPSGPKGLSRFNLTIPDIDPQATSYSIDIDTHYLTYRQETDSDQKHNGGSFHNNTIQINIILKKSE